MEFHPLSADSLFIGFLCAITAKLLAIVSGVPLTTLHGFLWLAVQTAVLSLLGGILKAAGESIWKRLTDGKRDNDKNPD